MYVSLIFYFILLRNNNKNIENIVDDSNTLVTSTILITDLKI